MKDSLSLLILSGGLTYFGQGCQHDPECDFKGDLDVLVVQGEEGDCILQLQLLQGSHPGGLEDAGEPGPSQDSCSSVSLALHVPGSCWLLLQWRLTLKTSKPFVPLPLLGRIPPTVIVGSRNGKPWKTPSYHSPQVNENIHNPYMEQDGKGKVFNAWDSQLHTKPFISPQDGGCGSGRFISTSTLIYQMTTDPHNPCVGDLEVWGAELGAVPVGSVAGAEQSQRVQEGSSGFGGFYVLLLGDLNTDLVQAVPYPAAGEEVCYGATPGQAFFKKLFVELCHFGFHVLVERGVGKGLLTEHEAPFSSFISRQGHPTGLFRMLTQRGLPQGNVYGEQDGAIREVITHMVQHTARVTRVAPHAVPPDLQVRIVLCDAEELLTARRGHGKEQRVRAVLGREKSEPNSTNISTGWSSSANFART
ncbi:hypothetical protein IHE44_0003290 [Lamprotornis superbus]|uniref:Uncharacterized protein n=1 Tax=Lamprotornis superbus TaxID=245042 RepID=A0A835NZ14_9PASS|nr:hypothetical protein IHE44_0003290 [Lamprotornis superbus]